MLKAYSNDFGELTDFVYILENNYESNENKEGLYSIIYGINLNEYKDISYTLYIYNIDFSKNIIKKELFVNDLNLNEKELIKLFSDKLNIKVIDLNLIEINKLNKKYIVKTNDNKTYEITLTYQKNNNFKYLLILTVIIPILAITIYLFWRKKSA